MKNFVLTVLCIALAILICIACAVYGFGYRYINLPDLELKYFGTVDKDLQPLFTYAGGFLHRKEEVL